MSSSFKRRLTFFVAAAILGIRVFAAVPPSADERFAAVYDETFLPKVLNSFCLFITEDFTSGQHISGAVAVGGTADLRHNIGPYTNVDDGMAAHAFGGKLLLSGSSPFTATPVRPRALYVSPSANVTTSYENGVWSYTAGSKALSWREEPNVTLKLTDYYMDFAAADTVLKATATNLSADAVHITLADLEAADIGKHWTENKPLAPLAGGVTYGYQTAGSLGVTRTLALTIPAGANVVLEEGVMEHAGTLNFTGNIYTEATVVTVEGSKLTFTAPWLDGNAFPIAAKWYGESMGLIWNLPDATNVTLSGHFGHVLAPNAHVEIGGGNMDGAVIAASAHNTAECHAWGFHAELPIGPIGPVVPTPTPTPTPSPTESVSPSPSPTESVSPSPSPTESVSPSPSPTESVSPSPSPTESVSPSPSPTESVSPSPSPTESVSPSPSPTESVSPSPSPTESVSPSPSPTGTPEPSPSPSRPNPDTEIPDEAVPRFGGSGSSPAPTPSATPTQDTGAVVLADGTPLGNLPQTGTKTSSTLLPSLGILTAALSLSLLPLLLRPGRHSGRKLK